MQESEFNSVIWDTKAAGSHEEGAAAFGPSTHNQASSPLASNNNNNNNNSSTSVLAAPFSGLGGSSQDSMDDGDLDSSRHFGGSVAYSSNLAESSSRPNRERIGAADGHDNAAGEASTSSAAIRENGSDASIGSADVETEVTVSQPRKEGEGTSNPYITYLVTTTRRNRQTKEMRRYALRRRFQDFLWLHDQLDKQFVACATPPLPGKHRMEYLTGDRFSEDFVNKRKHGLERFLRRVILHPSLRASQHLTIFLEAKDWSSEYELKQKSENGVLDTIGDTLLNTFSKVRKRDERFVEMHDTISRLSDNLIRTQKLYMRVTKRQQDLQQAYEELGTGLIDLGDIETGMTLALVEAGNALKAHHLALRQLAENTEDLFLGEIEEYISYCEAYMELLKMRDQKQAEFEDLTEYLQQTVSERERLTNHQSAVGVSAVTNFIKGKVRDLRGVDPAISRQQRIENLAERITELESAVDASREDSSIFSELVATEYEIFGIIKQHDFKRAFSALAASHILFFSKAVDIWKAVIPELEKLPVD
ncbi:intercellular trafficking and secretion [Coemansia erecta]|uniref:Sorting nexin-4 n=1 Tax=Coemansia erecta TaxID=147472 RepID=A0A9W8CVG8_9FUNG|nr:intercellular trafficking and secretion [Coemansia erecta]